MTPKIGTLIKNSKIYYHNLKPIISPALKQSVVFNRYGWKHLIYDSQDHRRNNKVIELRLFLLRDARHIIGTSNNPIISSISTNALTKEQTKYYEICDKSKRTGKFVKVIIRQINNGTYHFYSIRRSKRNKKPA